MFLLFTDLLSVLNFVLLIEKQFSDLLAEGNWLAIVGVRTYLDVIKRELLRFRHRLTGSFL